MTTPILPLGLDSDYPNRYDANVLFPIARADSRAELGLETLPFHGVDYWNAWEITWLSPTGLPLVATAEIQFSAESVNLIESKSLKLYLGSFAMSRYDSPQVIQDLIAADLGQCANGDVKVILKLANGVANSAIAELPGLCIDELAVRCDSWEVNPSLLTADQGDIADEALHTHLLRSLCPVTTQPDIGSLAIRYVGPRIDPASFLKYVVSFREHNDFHEACIERIFVDIVSRCHAEKLSVYARYQRRGGLDINPFRSNFEGSPENIRLWRQ